MEPSSDESLRRQVAAGDDAAFERLYHDYARRVQLVAWRFCPRAEVVADIVNEAWCRAYQSRSDYDPARPFLAWVCGILHNVWREHARDTVAPGSQVEAASDELSDEADAATEPAIAMAEAEMLDTLNDCVSRLEPAERDLIRLRFFENQTLRSVAQKVGIPEATLREHRLPAVISRLKACLKAKGIKNDFFEFSPAQPALRLQYPPGDSE